MPCARKASGPVSGRQRSVSQSIMLGLQHGNTLSVVDTFAREALWLTSIKRRSFSGNVTSCTMSRSRERW
eukprot:13587449-Heterocapsa_arctica.AAC.1